MKHVISHIKFHSRLLLSAIIYCKYHSVIYSDSYVLAFYYNRYINQLTTIITVINIEIIMI